MTKQHPVRACAIQEHDWDEPRLITLWETDPHFQVIMLQAVERSNAIDREFEPDPRILAEEGGPLHTLVWRVFPSLAAVDAANAAWHEEKFFEELAWQFDDPKYGHPITTVPQRIQQHRELCQAWGELPLRGGS